MTTSGHFRDSLNRVVGKTGARVLAPNFSRPPEHKYPTALNECRKAYEWIVGRVVRPETQIFLAGDSAGGGLAVALAVDLRRVVRFPEYF